MAILTPVCLRRDVKLHRIREDAYIRLVKVVDMRGIWDTLEHCCVLQRHHIHVHIQSAQQQKVHYVQGSA